MKRSPACWSRTRTTANYLRLAGVVFLAWHSVVILSVLPHKMRMLMAGGPTLVSVTGNLSALYNSTTDTVTVIDRSNVTFTKLPDCHQHARYQKKEGMKAHMMCAEPSKVELGNDLNNPNNPFHNRSNPFLP